ALVWGGVVLEEAVLEHRRGEVGDEEGAGVEVVAVVAAERRADEPGAAPLDAGGDAGVALEQRVLDEPRAPVPERERADAAAAERHPAECRGTAGEVRASAGTGDAVL